LLKAEKGEKNTGGLWNLDMRGFNSYFDNIFWLLSIYKFFMLFL
jgi:hypothetical protein